MKFYQEITIIPNHEIGENFILSRLFTQIHLGLVEMQDEQNKSPIGISFPEGKFDDKIGKIGNKLRLFAADEAILQKFNAQKCLANFADYVHLTSIRQVPQKITGYAIYSRHQPKVNKERLARRYSKRHGVDYATALKHYEDMEDKRIALPFIRLKSLSGGESFCLWIKKTLVDKAISGNFTTYGLSNISNEEFSNRESCVPEFN